jgi:hypothetical protein
MTGPTRPTQSRIATETVSRTLKGRLGGRAVRGFNSRGFASQPRQRGGRSLARRADPPGSIPPKLFRRVCSRHPWPLTALRGTRVSGVEYVRLG